MNYKYDVALSFSGEQREYVEAVANYLGKHAVSAFYDNYEEADMWGKDLYEHLDEIYRKEARYCVIFLSKDYASKLWTNHERKSAQARAFKEKGEYILPARFDDTEIPCIRPTIGYVDLREKAPEELGALILEKLGRKDIVQSDKTSEPFRRPRIKKRLFNPYDEVQNFISFISTELKKRCKALSGQGVSLSTIDKGDRRCFRVVCNGKTKYSLDISIGGFVGDSSLGFFGIQGEPHFSSGSMNASGSFVWDKERELPVLDFHDLSLFDSFNANNRKYTKEEFLDALWHKVCDALESEN